MKGIFDEFWHLFLFDCVITQLQNNILRNFVQFCKFHQPLVCQNCGTATFFAHFELFNNNLLRVESSQFFIALSYLNTIYELERILFVCQPFLFDYLFDLLDLLLPPLGFLSNIYLNSVVILHIIVSMQRVCQNLRL